MHGADSGFNGQWTAITSIRKQIKRQIVKIGYLFRCGCGHETRYLNTHFPDSYFAATKAREFHVCSGRPKISRTVKEGRNRIIKARQNGKA